MILFNHLEILEVAEYVMVGKYWLWLGRGQKKLVWTVLEDLKASISKQKMLMPVLEFKILHFYLSGLS